MEENQRKKGININTVMNIVLFIGLAVLYVLYFTNKKGGTTEESPNKKKIAENIPAIAYVNSDSLLENYKMYEEMQDNLAAKQKKLEGQLEWQRSQFEKEAQEFYQKVQSGGFLTRESAEKEQMRLAEKEQQIMQMSQKLGSDLANYELEWHSKVLDTVVNFLKRYNKKHEYDFILGYAKGGGILLANDSLEITDEVLKLINTEYKSEDEDNEKKKEAN